jgi:hypothetical protein
MPLAQQAAAMQLVDHAHVEGNRAAGHRDSSVSTKRRNPQRQFQASDVGVQDARTQTRRAADAHAHRPR